MQWCFTYILLQITFGLTFDCPTLCASTSQQENSFPLNKSEFQANFSDSITKAVAIVMNSNIAIDGAKATKSDS